MNTQQQAIHYLKMLRADEKIDQLVNRYSIDSSPESMKALLLEMAQWTLKECIPPPERQLDINGKKSEFVLGFNQCIRNVTSKAQYLGIQSK